MKGLQELTIWLVIEPSGHKEPFLRESAARAWLRHAPEGSRVIQFQTEIPDPLPTVDQVVDQ